MFGLTNRNALNISKSSGAHGNIEKFSIVKKLMPPIAKGNVHHKRRLVYL